MKVSFRKISDARETHTFRYKLWSWSRDHRGHEIIDTDNSPGWNAEGCMSGPIEELPYVGGKSHWHVEIESTLGELKGWLEEYVKAHPKEALVLLADMIQLAVKKEACEAK